MVTMQQKFMREINEVAFTSYQVETMLDQMGLCRSTTSILSYVKKHNLFVDLKGLGIRPTGRSAVKYWIPKSNLEKIMEGFNLPVTTDELMSAAYELNYQF